VSKTKTPAAIKSYKLPSGLRIVMETIPFVRSVSFGIWVRNGSRNESTRLSGMSHFIEHMLFKGTQKRTATEIAETMDEVGGQLNAFTSKEYTCYFARTLDTHFDVALDVLTDMFFNSKFDEAEIDKERNVILEEINMYEDTPSDLVVDLLQYQTFQKNPLGRSILGVPNTINKFKRDDFIKFVEKNYRPHNTVIAVAGNIDEQAVLDKISAAFVDFKGTPKQKTTLPVVYTPGFNLREKDIEQVHLAVGFPGLRWTGNEEYYALAAVNTIFGGGMSSRLFQKLREERGLVYSVYSHNISYIDTGIFMIYAALNQAQLYDALGLITEEARRLFTDRVTESQLAKTREQLKSNTLLSLESASSRMNSIGAIQLMMNKITTPDEVVAKIDAITLDSFYEVCERVFKFDEMSLSLVGRGVENINLPDLIKNK
jgi:predicted Zn-dependent peptidase